MKKLALSLAGVLAATAFAPEASAVPAFARQTGMACSACHYQHFPLLNGFGRAFKSSGFTLMGAQGRIEGDNNLSIPDVVNLGVFTTAYFQTQGHEKVAGVDQGADPALGKWGVPGTGGELSLFIGGRVTEFAGFLAEAGLGGGAAAVGPAKLAVLFPVGDYRIGPVIYTSPDQGAAYSFETLNTGAVGTHKMMGNTGPSDQHVQAAYAAQYLGTKTAATGINVVANGGMGFLNIGAYEMAGNDKVGGANNLDLTYIRAAATFDLVGWDSAVGIQNFGGKSAVSGALQAVPAQFNSPRATIVDFQMQGDMGTIPVGFYASYGTASAGSATETNPFNAHMEMVGGVATAVAGTQSKHSLNVAAEFGFIPHVATVQVAVRAGKNGAATNNGDNAVMLGVAYEIAQNMALTFHHTQQSGSAWNANAAGDELPGKDANTLLLETAF